MTSLLLPSFLQRLAEPSVKTVLLCGCGGGFDFVHSMALLPELLRLDKRVVIGSYSFGDPDKIGAPAPVVFQEGQAVVRKVTAQSVAAPYYAPEIHMCSFLDARCPSTAPHFVYAYYARAFCVPVLTRFYSQLIATHDVDAVVLVDGGSDSLMVGDEEGLGDPIEDAVSVAAVAALSGLKHKILLSAGLGADRFNQVSDAASLRAIAELTAQGHFLGACSLEPTQPAFSFYKDCVSHIYERQGFRSVLTGMILAAGEGHYGGEVVPPILQPRVQPGKFFLWPLMPMFWAFDVKGVAARSRIVPWIRDCDTPFDCQIALYQGRDAIKDQLRNIENLPRHQDMRFSTDDE